mgnify:CR=1 FL=1
MNFSKLKPILTVLALVVIATVGVLWWRQGSVTRTPAEPKQQLVTWVDRGIDEGNRVKFDAKLAEIRSQIAEAEASGKREISLYLQLGNWLYSTGDLGLAEDAYRNILSTNPQDVPALQNLGQTLLEMGDVKGAEQVWRQSLTLEPSEDYYIRLSNLITEKYPARQAEIQKLLEDAIATLGQTPALLIRLAMWYEAKGDFDQAISHYEVALQLEPANQSLKDKITELRQKRTETK